MSKTADLRTVPEMLIQAAELYTERNKLYGDNYKCFGSIMMALQQGMPNTIKSPEDWNRIGILVQMVAKLSRYVENFHRGGHADSLNDLAVYSMMLQELDNLEYALDGAAEVIGG